MIYIYAPPFKQHLNLARRTIAVWDIYTARHTSTQLSDQMVYAFAHSLMSTGQLDSAYVLILSFDGYLRSSEDRYLKWRYLTFLGGCRLDGHAPHTDGLSVADAKTATEVGERQLVPLMCPRVSKLLVLVSREQSPE